MDDRTEYEPAPVEIEPDSWDGPMHLAAGPGFDIKTWPAREISRLSRNGWFYETDGWTERTEYFIRTRYRTGTGGTVYCYDDRGVLTHLYSEDDNVRTLVRAV